MGQNNGCGGYGWCERSRGVTRLLVGAVLASFVSGCGDPAALADSDTEMGASVASLRRLAGTKVHAQVLARGIPGAGAVCEVGAFLPGGAMHELPELATYTELGRVSKNWK